MLSRLAVLAPYLSLIACQNLPTYTGCHQHGATEFCFDSNGAEIAVFTYTDDVAASATTPAANSATASAEAQTTAVTSCHAHATEIFCVNGHGEEVQVSLTATPTGELPAQYTGCHAHGTEQFCQDPAGEDVLILAAAAEEENGNHDHGDDDDHDHSEEGELDCHFHAGVEHCVPKGGAEGSHGSSTSSADLALACNVSDREYDVPLRIGTLFVVLVTSSIGVFAPLLLNKISFLRVNGVVFTAIKQFGTGIIVSTAFIHLYTHANLMFTNQCLGRLEYEGTTSAVVMAGIFLAWLVEYVGHRIVLARSSKKLPTHSIDQTSESSPDRSLGDKSAKTTLANLGHNHGNPYDPSNPNTKLSVLVMEAGILFHSILIGLTLVVAGDSFYKTLLVVIVFHQFFEGLALGARISLLPGGIWWQKTVMASAFALITPIGMAIGLGVLNQFNGNNRATIITIGTLDALSAGILIWVGLVDMWARDWIIEGGEMVNAQVGRVLVGGFSLVAGLVLMSVLGKWA